MATTSSAQATVLKHLYKTHILPEPPWDFTEDYDTFNLANAERALIEREWSDAIVNWVTRVALDVMVAREGSPDRPYGLPMVQLRHGNQSKDPNARPWSLRGVRAIADDFDNGYRQALEITMKTIWGVGSRRSKDSRNAIALEYFSVFQKKRR